MRALRLMVLLGVFLSVLVGPGPQRVEANGVAGLVGVVDTTTGQWHLRGPDGFTTSFFYGNPGDVPFLGDWDCDGVETPGLYRQSDGYVYLRNSNTQGIADIRFFFGNPGDVPLPGDFNGDLCDTVSIYRPSEARIYIIDHLGDDDGGLGAADYFYDFGNPGDKPFVADFDGDGVDTVGLHRESTGLVYYRNANTTGIADAQFVFGDPGDLIIAGDWTGDGTDTVGLFRPDDARMYLRYSNTQGNADESFDYGTPQMVPVGGATGITTVAVADRDWHVTRIAEPGDSGRFTSVGFGAHGRAIVSHGIAVAINEFRASLTRCRDLDCLSETSSLSAWRVSDHTSMATGADWRPIWSFHDRERLIVAHCDDPQCTTVTYSIARPKDGLHRTGILSALTIGADDRAVIVYLSEIGGYRVAHCNDTACSSNTSTNISGSGSDFDRFDIAIGADGLPLVAFVEALSPLRALHCLDVSCNNGTNSTVSAIGAAEGYVFPSVAVGTDGLPIIAYNQPGVELDVVHCDDVACTSRSTETILSMAVDWVSADIGGDGLPFIAFRESGALKVAHCDDAACTSTTITTVDPGPGVGEFTALATDPFGMPVIAYYDAINHDLKFARLGS